jgi:hypothetical protein
VERPLNQLFAHPAGICFCPYHYRRQNLVILERSEGPLYWFLLLPLPFPLPLPLPLLLPFWLSSCRDLLLHLLLLFFLSFPLGICFFFCSRFCPSVCHSERSEEPASRLHSKRPFFRLTYFAAIAASANGCIIAYPAPFGCTPSLLIPGFIPPSGPAIAVQ